MNIGDAPGVDVAGRDQPGIDEVADPLRGVGIPFAVVVHAAHLRQHQRSPLRAARHARLIAHRVAMPARNPARANTWTIAAVSSWSAMGHPGEGLAQACNRLGDHGARTVVGAGIQIIQRS